MQGHILYLAVMWIVAVFCICWGIYARTRKAPMWFLTGERIPADEISDVAAYNRANGRMWCLCSVPYWIAGVVELWYPAVAMIFFAVFCVFGIAWILWYHDRIEHKYRKK